MKDLKDLEPNDYISKAYDELVKEVLEYFNYDKERVSKFIEKLRDDEYARLKGENNG